MAPATNYFAQAPATMQSPDQHPLRFEHPLRFARWLRFARPLRGWRTAAAVPISLAASVTAVLIPISILEGSLAAQAIASTKPRVVALTPARGQPHPTSLWAARPIPLVFAAARLALHDAPLPAAIVPSQQVLAQQNHFVSYDIPRGCQPSFGSGVTSRICRLGDPSSKRVVAVLGDSHAGMWMPALVADARSQKFAVVALDKPGCFINDLGENRPGWPCASWYSWVLARDHALHPVATIVSFDISTALQAQASSTISELQSVLSQVTNGVMLADPPSQVQLPADCVFASGANMGRCSTRVPSTFTPFMKALARMVAQTHHPAIPTLQWFCAGGVCPMVIDDTLTTRDLTHLSMQYSADLAPVLGLELERILARHSARQTRATQARVRRARVRRARVRRARA